MAFFNPLMLLGLGLVAIPVIIHLFNLRKARKVNFSSLMFVRQVEETEIKKLRLKEIILLLIRIFLIVFLVLSFANPVLESKFTLTDIKNKSVLVFFDDSFSLNNKSAGVNYFNNSKSSASEIAGFYNPTDNIRIFSGTDKLTAPQEIMGTVISHRPFFFNEILETVNVRLGALKSILNEVIIISDFSSVNFREYPGAAGFSADKENVFFYLLDIAGRKPSNVSVQDVTLVNEFPDLNADMVFRVKIINHNDFPVSSASFRMKNNGMLVHSANLDFTDNEIKEFEVRFKPFAYGEQKIESFVNITNPAEDELTEDNSFFNVIYIPENFRIMIVSDDYENANYIIKSFIAFNAESGTDRISFSLRNAVTEEMNGYDVIYLIKKDFNESEINLLEKLSALGKGIFVFPPENAVLQNLNSLLSRISSLGFQAKEYNSENIKISEIKTEHPLFYGVFRTGENQNDIQNPESPDIKSYFRIFEGENTYPVISLNNGSALVSEYSKGNSRIILSALPPDFSMSDFPAKNFFLPMIIRGVFHLSDADNLVRNFRIGAEIISGLIKFKIDSLFKPDGVKISAEGNNIEIIKHSDRTGFYEITDSSSVKMSFAVNNDTCESYLEKKKESSVIEYFKSLGFSSVEYFSNTDELKSAVEKNRKGIELTPFFLFLAVVFIILEIIYSSFLMRRKAKTANTKYN
jgi:hypothetical protein